MSASALTTRRVVRRLEQIGRRRLPALVLSFFVPFSRIRAFTLATAASHSSTIPRRGVKTRRGDEQQRRRGQDQNPRRLRIAQTDEDCNAADPAGHEPGCDRLKLLILRVASRFPDFFDRHSFGVFVENFRRRRRPPLPRRSLRRASPPPSRRTFQRQARRPAVDKRLDIPIRPISAISSRFPRSTRLFFAPFAVLR